MWGVDPNVLHDPVFQDLLQKQEVAGRKLRDAVIAMRSFHLTLHKAPQDYDISEKWKAAHLGENAAQHLDSVRDAAADLLRYAYEIASHSNCPEHLKQVSDLKKAHNERVRTGAPKVTRPEQVRGFEEKVLVDGGPPITIVIQPKHYEFTERYKKRRKRQKPK